MPALPTWGERRESRQVRPPNGKVETLAARLAWRSLIAVAPRLCVTAFRRLCSEQRCYLRLLKDGPKCGKMWSDVERIPGPGAQGFPRGELSGRAVATLFGGMDECPAADRLDFARPLAGRRNAFLCR